MKQRLIILFTVLSVVGCSGRALVVHELTGMINTGLVAMESETDLALAREAFPGNIKLLETMLVNDPDNGQLQLLLARLYASYAFAFLETDMEAAQLSEASSADPDAIAERAVLFYGRAQAYALNALELDHSGLAKRLEAGNAAAAVFGELDTDDAPALFWYGFALGARINLQRDNVALLARAPMVAAAMHRVVDVAPTYFHGGAHMALMLYYGGRTAAMGGQPDLADDHYAKLKGIAGEDYLLADVVYARHALVNRADRDGFARLLSAAKAMRTEKPAYGMMNAVARRRAAMYLPAVDDFFL